MRSGRRNLLPLVRGISGHTGSGIRQSIYGVLAFKGSRTYENHRPHPTRQEGASALPGTVLAGIRGSGGACSEEEEHRRGSEATERLTGELKHDGARLDG
jgi:hypothetical protein